MTNLFSPEEIAFNASLDAYELLLRMGLQESQLYREGNTIRLFCPFHKDTVRRSMIVYADRNTYKCQYTMCPAHSGGNLLQFYSSYTGVPFGEAMDHIRNAGGHGGEDLVERADKLIQEGLLADALPVLQKAVQLDPDNEISRCRLAALYLELGDRETGFREYMTAAEHFGVRGELDKTLNIYNILVVITPDDVKVRKQLATLFSRLKRNDEAVAQLKWVVDRHIHRGELAQAADICRKMIELSPNYPDSHRILGELMLKRGDYVAAGDEFVKAAGFFVRENNFTRAKQTVDLGLRYMAGNTELKTLREKLAKAIEMQKAKADRPDEQETDFQAWLQELKASIGLVPAPATGMARRPAAAGTAAAEAGIAGDSAAPVARAGKPRKTRKRVAQEVQSLVSIPKLDPNDPRIAFCLEQIRDKDAEELDGIYAHLVSTFRDVQQGLRSGSLTEIEAGALLEFYAAFCVAFDTYRGAMSAAQD